MQVKAVEKKKCSEWTLRFILIKLGVEFTVSLEIPADGEYAKMWD